MGNDISITIAKPVAKYDPCEAVVAPKWRGCHFDSPFMALGIELPIDMFTTLMQ